MGKRLIDPPSGRIRWAILISILVLLLVRTTAKQVNAGQFPDQQPQPQPTAPPVQEQIAAMEVPVREVPLANVKFKRDKTPQTVNILLVGSDDTEEAGARSDTMILCTFDRVDNTITMTSFLRDLYVKIPGHGKNRINAAYSYGGIELLNQTLQENFEIKVDGNIQVDFACFEKIIDLLGGVTMELTAAEASFINKRLDGSSLTEGTHQLTGAQALLYARDRYDRDGDFSRTNRQRKLLQVLLETCRHKKLTQMLRLMREMLPMVTMDIPRSDLTEYAMTLIPMLTDAEVRAQSIPVADGFYHAKIDGMYVLVPDLEKNKEVLADLLK